MDDVTPRDIGLRYSTDAGPGILRKRSGKGFCYYDPAGNLIRDAGTLGRIRSLVIPPAWKDVWICLHESGHLQATGRDDKGRKQAIYHPDWRAFREQTKFERLSEFGRALPKIRAQVEADLRKQGLPREKVVATVVRLLETTLIRIGNRAYAVQNRSFGLTTLRTKHVEVGAQVIRFRFMGKSGKFHEIEYRDRRLAALVRKIQELPGQSLFQYLDESGARSEVSSGEVNAYLKEASGKDFTAKEFRTWKATVEMVRLLRCLRQEGPLTKKAVNEAVKHVARLLGNTPTVCRASYIHPAAFPQPGEDPEWLNFPMPGRAPAHLEPIESFVLRKVLG